MPTITARPVDSLVHASCGPRNFFGEADLRQSGCFLKGNHLYAVTMLRIATCCGTPLWRIKEF